MPERWLPIPGYEDAYEVSDQGQVRSLDRYVYSGSRVGWTLLRGKQRATRLDRFGRPAISLTRDAMGRTVRVQDLVLLAFVGPKPAGLEVRHLNDVKIDNRLANLAYGTSKENRADAVRNGRNANRNRTHCPQGHPYDEQNTYVLPSRPGARYCRACGIERQRRRRTHRRERQIAEALA